MYKSDHTTVEMANFRYNPDTTFVIPKSLIKKIPLKYLFKLALFYAGLEKIDRKDLKHLFKLGFAEQYFLNEDDVIKILCSKSPQHASSIKEINLHTCFWCKCTSYILSEHHYPIRKKNGGDQIINICSNCHMEFHYLVDNSFYKLKQEYEDEFISSYLEMRNYILEKNHCLDGFISKKEGA